MTEALARSLAAVDRELDQLAGTLGPGWKSPAVERVTLESATEALDALARGVDVPTKAATHFAPRGENRVSPSESAPATTTQPVVEAAPPTVMVEAAPPTVIVEAAPPTVIVESAPEAAVTISLDEPEFETEPESSGVLEALAAVPSTADATIDESVFASALATILDDGASIVDEPEFLSSPVEPEANVSVDADDVLVEEEPAPLPRAASSRPSDGNDLGELMFDLEPELNVGVYDMRTSSPRLVPSSTKPPGTRESTEPARPVAKPTARLPNSADNLELDLSDLLNDTKTPSIRPPPLLRPPPPQRTAPPPVPRGSKVRFEPDVVELIDEDEIEIVRASSSPPGAGDSKAPPPLPPKAPDTRS